MTKPWIYLKAVSHNPKLGRWTTHIRTPGTRTYRVMRAKTFAEIVVLYLAHTFDRESLMAAAEMAEPRETKIKRMNAIHYQQRMETYEP